MEGVWKILQGMSVSDTIALFALLLSVISGILSVKSLRLQKKLNMQNLQAVYFEKIFQEYLLKKIPEAVIKINFSWDGKLRPEYRNVNKVMMDMIKGARYFLYANQNFYIELAEKTKHLEDALLELSNKVIPDKQEQDKELIKIHMLVSEIIGYINNSYCK